jgi:hypothetical protein
MRRYLINITVPIASFDPVQSLDAHFVHFVSDRMLAIAPARGTSREMLKRCQIHKARNIMGWLAPALHASVRRASPSLGDGRR